MTSSLGTRACVPGRRMLLPPSLPCNSWAALDHQRCVAAHISQPSCKHHARSITLSVPTTNPHRPLPSFLLHQGPLSQQPSRCSFSSASFKGSRPRLPKRLLHASCVNDTAASAQSATPDIFRQKPSHEPRFSKSSSPAAFSSSPKFREDSTEHIVRRRSSRIARLPRYKTHSSAPAAIMDYSSLSPRTTPTHPILLAIHQQQPASDRPLGAEAAATICKEQYKSLDLSDVTFILETVQDLSTSQQEFWESMLILIRYSIPHIKERSNKEAREWQHMLSSAMLEVYWKQNQSVFVGQIDRMKEQMSLEYSESRLEPFSSDAEILSHAMIETLFSTFYTRQAVELYGILSERGIGMPGRLISSLIRIAVDRGDGYQLERIGNLLLRHEMLYRKFARLSSPDNTLSTNRPLLMSAKVMDSFIRGACENELYELARAVFDRGLEAGQNYRAITFTRILNSYSVKEFGFDIVSAAASEAKRVRPGRRLRKVKGADDGGTVEGFSQLAEDPSFGTPRITRAIAVADPKEIEKYVSAMEEQGCLPNVTTLNVLVKLYLEMAQYKTANAPAWKSAFKTYNPLGLEPDLVTNNTLLAFYEKHKDLTTMRKIYDDLAHTHEGRGAASKRARQLRMQQAGVEHGKDSSHSSIGDATTQHSHSEEEWIYDRRSQEQRSTEQNPPRHRGRSKRDIYTYNTMLHALLQHAVESKDIASIGQCFHDMELDGISADTVTFNSNIMYHVSRGDLSAAMQVFRSMKSGKGKAGRSSAISGDPWSPMGAYTEVSPGDRSSARRSSKPVKSKSSAHSIYTRSARASALSTQRDEGEEDATNQETPPISASSDDAGAPASLMDSPPPPDVVTLTSLISGFGQADQMDKATNIFNEMTRRFEIEPNLKTYSTLVAGLHRAGDHTRAERLWGIVLEEDDQQRHRAEEPYKNKVSGETGLPEEEIAERLQQERQLAGQTAGHLTIMERRQIETRRKLSRD